jgi:hypothetical protein
MGPNESFTRRNQPVVKAEDTARHKRVLLATLDFMSMKSMGYWFSARNDYLWIPDAFMGPMGSLMRAIEDALARISAGRFGACEVCKQPISKARLEAVPWTRVCRDCKEEQSPHTGKRP